MARAVVRKTVLLAVLVLAVPAVSLSGNWPSIGKGERSLTHVPGFPNAPAVVLFERGTFYFNARSVSSYLEVYRRVKVLREEGRDYGSVHIPSSRYYRVKDVAGRTHQPDGRTVDLADDAVFSKEYSGFYRRQTISVAMPQVTVGSIVEYRYKIFFDSVIYPEPWYFQSEIPVIHSEAVYYVPNAYRFKPYGGTTMRGRQIQNSVDRKPKGLAATFSLDNLAPIPDEPSRYPMEDLSSWVVVLPEVYASSGFSMMLFSDWGTAVDLVRGNDRYGYVYFRKGAGKVKKEAKKLIAGLKDPRARAEAVYRFVRDRIITEEIGGISEDRRRANEVLDSGRADYIEKALLLQLMLRVAKVPASVAWVRPATIGRVRRKVPNPYQFTRGIVVARIGGKETFLYPGDGVLAFGALPPSLEGVPCLLVDRKKPEWTSTPITPAEQSAAESELDLHIEEGGRIVGTGTVRLTGHEAWRRLDWEDTEADRLSRWTDWLERHLPGFAVDDVKLEEDVEGRALTVRWTLALDGDSDSLDEISLRVTAPLSRAGNSFTLRPSQRLTPVQLWFPWAERIRLRLSWPEGWTAEVLPRFSELSNAVGKISGSVDLDPAQRTLDVSTSREVTRRDLPKRSDYVALNNLYRRLTANDEEEVVLVKGATSP